MQSPVSLPIALLKSRKHNLKSGAPSLLTNYLYGTSGVLIYDPPRDTKAQTRALRFGGKERRENSCLVLLGDSRAIVFTPFARLFHFWLP